MVRKQPSILIIEDNLGDILLIQETLNALGIDARVQTITDGERALFEIAAIDTADVPSLIIIDLNLPRVNGIELLAQVRKLSKFAHTRIMVLTSSQSPEDRLQAEKLGADAFVSKPLTLDEFLRRTGDAIRQLIGEECGESASGRVSREPSGRPPRRRHRDRHRQFSRRSVGWIRAASQA